WRLVVNSATDSAGKGYHHIRRRGSLPRQVSAVAYRRSRRIATSELPDYRLPAAFQLSSLFGNIQCRGQDKASYKTPHTSRSRDHHPSSWRTKVNLDNVGSDYRAARWNRMMFRQWTPFFACRYPRFFVSALSDG